MSNANDTIRVFIPLSFRRRNGRPCIMPPEPDAQFQSRVQDPHILRALGRAWSWRRKLETGEAATIHDIARDEKVTDRFVSRMMRLAYLSPEVLERLVVWRLRPSISLSDLVKVSYLPWADQMARVFDSVQTSAEDFARRP